MKRTAVVSLVVALLSGLAHAQAPKPLPADVGSGRVAWFDLTTTDLARSKEFYGRLFDWTFAPVPGTDHAVEIVSRGTGIGTIRMAEGRASTANGVVYVQVEDAEAACAKASALGASIVPGFPFDLSTGIGAIGLFVDPTGHPIGVYARTPIAARKPAAK